MLLKIFLNRRMFLMLLMGFASGLPLALTGATLQAWMTTEGIDLSTIGLFSLVGLPYTLKFLWAPLMDRFQPPFLGRRRGWMLFCQLSLMALIIFLGFSRPAQMPGLMACLALAVAFLSASQDIVIDAYRTEFLRKEEFGTGAGVAIMGYRIGMLVSGAMALMLADFFSWQAVYCLMAGLLLFGIYSTLSAPEPIIPSGTPRALREAVLGPLLDYFRRKGAWEVLSFIVLYRIDVVIAVSLVTPFLLKLGFSKTEIAGLNKTLGLLMTILGSLAGGAMIPRLGMKRALLIFGVLQCFSTLLFSLLAAIGFNHLLLALAVSGESFCSGLGNAAFIAFLMGLCNKRYTATQYALLTSLGALSRVFAGAPMGFLAEAVGWVSFFNLATLSGLPGLLLVYFRYNYWDSGEKQDETIDS